MRLRIGKKEKEITHWPATSGDIALAVPCSQSLVRYYILIGLVRPHTDSRGRSLFLPDDLATIKAHRERQRRGK